jgi:methanogenic corrinoid protein MtbC1
LKTRQDPAAILSDAALQALPSPSGDIPSYLVQDAPLASLTRAYLAALLDGDRRHASTLILDAVAAGVGVKDIYLHIFQRSQYEVGRLWQIHDISVAQEHYCTAATQLVMSQLYPYIFAAASTRGTLVATCVSGDLHEIGVRMVADFFEMEGWNTYYLGASTPTDEVVGALVERKADILAISATLSGHLRAVATLIDTVRANEACRHVTILVGGYPFAASPDLWREIGADGTAPDAQGAIVLAGQFLDRQLPS